LRIPVIALLVGQLFVAVNDILQATTEVLDARSDFIHLFEAGW